MTSTINPVTGVGPDDGRRRTSRPHLHLPECGTITGYNKGCGCQPCRDASATARRAQRIAARTGIPREVTPPVVLTVVDRARTERPELNLPQCGTPRGYQMGCGCVPCREAKSKQRKDLYDRNKDKPKADAKPDIPNRLPVVVVERLRTAVACMGCGAVRRSIEGRKTRIKHRKGCPTARIKEG